MTEDLQSVLDSFALDSRAARCEAHGCGLRFLTDYLDGDRYFMTHRARQNLGRCRAQRRLVEDMETKWEQMQRIVQEERG